LEELLVKTKIFYMALVLLIISSCSSKFSNLDNIIEKNPDIIFNIIEQNPTKFMEIINLAANKTHKAAREKAQDALEAARESEYKDPRHPKIEANRPQQGPSNAPITIVSYSEVQCPQCLRGNDILHALKRKYQNKIRIISKHLALPKDKEALPAAQWFHALALQNSEKAYEFLDKLLENSNKLNHKFYKTTAKSLGLDVAKAEVDMNSQLIKNRIEADQLEAQKFSFESPPIFLINGVSLHGAMPEPEFVKIIDRLLASAGNS
jgi:protein-disulfide isomerase